MILGGNVEKPLPHPGKGELKAYDAGGRLLATVPRKDRMRGGDLHFAVLHRIVVVLHGVHKALGAVLVMLQDGRLVPSLINGLGVVVAKLPIRVHLHLAEDELPAGEAAHGGHEAQVRTKALDQLPLLLVLELPLAVAGVGDLGVEDQQMHQLRVAVVGIVAEGLAAAIRWKGEIGFDI